MSARLKMHRRRPGGPFGFENGLAGGWDNMEIFWASDWIMRGETKRKATPSSDAGQPLGPAAQALTPDRIEELQKLLQAAPAARQEQIERARKLLADPDYPSPEIVRRVAELLAAKLREEGTPNRIDNE